MTAQQNSYLRRLLKPLLASYGAIDAEIRFLGITLCWMQVGDGILTALGLAQLGIQSEGNPLLRHLMLQIGITEALLLAKAFAIFLVGFICWHSAQVPWLKKGLVVVNLIYLYLALIPWIGVLA